MKTNPSHFKFRNPAHIGTCHCSTSAFNPKQWQEPNCLATWENH